MHPRSESEPDLSATSLPLRAWGMSDAIAGSLEQAYFERRDVASDPKCNVAEGAGK